MKTEILDRDNPILRLRAEEVPTSHIGSKNIDRIIEKMKSTLHTQDDGVAIAAPQIGESLRIFVIKGKFAQEKDGQPDLVFINPKITKRSQKKSLMEEGCLSCRWSYGEVKRSEKVTMEAYDEKGRKLEVNASGLIAQIIQHECDHLDGILFIDKAVNLREIPPENNGEKS